jgi:hypothetical protein
MRLVVATGVCGPVRVLDTVLLHIAFKLSHARDGKCSYDGNPVTQVTLMRLVVATVIRVPLQQAIL